MKYRKIPLERGAEADVMSRKIRERLELIDKEMGNKLQTFDSLFAGTDEHPEQIHRLYIQPLLESGLTLRDSFALLVDGVLAPANANPGRPRLRPLRRKLGTVTSEKRSGSLPLRHLSGV